MTQWYKKPGAQIGLRVAGLGLIISAWFECGVLRRLVMETPAADMTGAEFLLGALMFLSASMGTALAIVGGGLWKPVQLSARWTGGVAAPVPREFQASFDKLSNAERERGFDPKGKAGLYDV